MKPLHIVDYYEKFKYVLNREAYHMYYMCVLPKSLKCVHY